MCTLTKAHYIVVIAFSILVFDFFTNLWFLLFLDFIENIIKAHKYKKMSRCNEQNLNVSKIELASVQDSNAKGNIKVLRDFYVKNFTEYQCLFRGGHTDDIDQTIKNSDQE